MPPTSTSQRWPRGPRNALHHAAAGGSIESTVALLSKGTVNINQRDLTGLTPLMIATDKGHSGIARILVNKGARATIAADDGSTCLHISAQNCELDMINMLVEAGADVDAATTGGVGSGSRPLHLAADEGYSDVIDVLIEAGADPNSRRLDGTTPLVLAAKKGHAGAIRALVEAGASTDSRLPNGLTPLFAAAYYGHEEAVRELLIAKADPLIPMVDDSGCTGVPLDAAATSGSPGVVRELIKRVGIEGCGGASAGVDALRQAAGRQHVEVLSALTHAGVVDTGEAVIFAAENGREASLKFLLRQQWGETAGERAHVNNIRDGSGKTLLFCSIAEWRENTPRIVRLLVEAGADAASAVRLTAPGKGVVFNDTPLAFVDFFLRVKKHGRKAATEEQLRQLEATRRLLLRVEAIHAVSFAWPSVMPVVGGAAGPVARRAARPSSAPLTAMLPILRRRAAGHGVLLTALSRYAGTKM